MRLGQPRRGQEHPLARLTDAQADLMRQRYRTGEASIRELMREKQQSYESTRRIVKGISYRNGKDSP